MGTLITIEDAEDWKVYMEKKTIEQICRIFLWTGAITISKKALVSWETVCKPQAASGLNIIDLKLWNKAAILKQLWNIARKKDCLWTQWMHNYFIKNRGIETITIPTAASWVVRKILGTRDMLIQTQAGQGDLKKEFVKAQKGGKFSTKMYTYIMPTFPRVEWKSITL
ncbi:hypothetical protein KY289_001655 [Solanum tuberosum]|nr:hypothetical protein KY289_001655 [Solanum tuberosum]